MGFLLMFKVVQVWGVGGNFEEFPGTLKKFRPVFPISKYFPQIFEIILSNFLLGIQLHFEGQGGTQIAQKTQKFKFENVFGVFGRFSNFRKYFSESFSIFSVKNSKILTKKS